ncbi:hypothetical protein JW960_16980 [candidate division KSB1 bacterium]|nr:hypothetical protein [candidate division KSB1 bacterium]
MRKIKVLISSRPKLLSEVIRNLVEQQSDMEMVGEVLDPLQLLRMTRLTPVDAVIITPLRANGEPKICHQLLVEYPPLKIVTLSASGDAAYLYQSDLPKMRIHNPSGESILTALREAMWPLISDN